MPNANNSPQIARLQAAISNIEKKLQEKHWSETARKVLHDIKARHTTALQILQKGK